MTAEMEAASSSFEITSVHKGINSLKPPGILDKVSATTFAFPGLYFMSKLKSASSPTHLNPVAFSFADDRTYVSGYYL